MTIDPLMRVGQRVALRYPFDHPQGTVTSVNSAGDFAVSFDSVPCCGKTGKNCFCTGRKPGRPRARHTFRRNQAHNFMDPAEIRPVTTEDGE